MSKMLNNVLIACLIIVLGIFCHEFVKFLLTQKTSTSADPTFISTMESSNRIAYSLILITLLILVNLKINIFKMFHKAATDSDIKNLKSEESDILQI